VTVARSIGRRAAEGELYDKLHAERHHMEEIRNSTPSLDEQQYRRSNAVERDASLPVSGTGKHIGALELYHLCIPDLATLTGVSFREA